MLLDTMSSDNPETRSRILKAALTLLEASQGKGVRMTDIAKRAGITRQALYLHFSTRAELLIATTHYLDALKGCKESILRFRPAIVVEIDFSGEWSRYSEKDVSDFLDEINYARERLDRTEWLLLPKEKPQGMTTPQSNAEIRDHSNNRVSAGSGPQAMPYVEIILSPACNLDCEYCSSPIREKRKDLLPIIEKEDFSLSPELNEFLDKIREFCKESLAPYKVPKIIEYTDELPRTKVGKIMRRKLKK